MKKIVYIVFLMMMCISLFSCKNRNNISDEKIGGIVYEKTLDNDWDPVTQRYIPHKKVKLMINCKISGWYINNYIYDNYNEDDSIWFKESIYPNMLKVVEK